MNIRALVISASIVFGLFVIMSSTFTIREGRQVILTQFGAPIRTVKDAGLHWKVPFIQKVREIDLRILNWDGYPNQIPTRDKKYISVDTTARWRIVDPLKFIQTVQSEAGATSRLDAILDATTRDIISSHNLVETVRNTNTIFDVIKLRVEELKTETAKDVNALDEEVTGEIEPIKIGRERLSGLIHERASKELVTIGIELIDVQLRRIMYEESVQKKVYDRMKSERERIAEKIRSIGKGEQAKIQGKTNFELEEIESSAYRTVQTIRGDAEAKAINIYAASLGADPTFYEFTRKLEAYKKSLKPGSKLILSSKSDFWNYLRKSP